MNAYKYFGKHSGALAALVLIHLFCTPARAEEQKPPQQVEKNPVSLEAEQFTKDFSEKDRRHFYVIFSNANMVKVVETVQNDVGMATEQCGKAHPEMKTKIEAQYTTWRAALDPVMTQARTYIDDMVQTQKYAQPKDIQKFIKKIDAARAEKDKEVHKVPATSVEACTQLSKTMDKTQDKLVKLLNGMLVSLPQAMQEDK